MTYKDKVMQEFDEEFKDCVYVSVPTDMDVKIDKLKSFIKKALDKQREIPVVRKTDDYAIVSWGKISYKVFPNGNIIKL